MGVIYFLKIIFSSPEVTAAMKKVSILNHVIGPVMRGPSSSHTAGPWRIGRMAANLLEAPPDRAVFTFHPSSSLAVCFRDQGSDLAFAAGLLGRPLTDPDFPRILSLAPGHGLDIRFEKAPFPEADHPNSSLLRLSGGGKELTIHSRSTGGGSFEIASVNGCPADITGESFILILEGQGEDDLLHAAATVEAYGWETSVRRGPGGPVLFGKSSAPLPESARETISRNGLHFNYAEPVMLPMPGSPLFSDVPGLLSLAADTGWSLGRAALASEASLLGVPEKDLMDEMERRLDIMLTAVRRGLAGDFSSMKLLAPTAERMLNSEKEGAMFTGGPHARAAIRSMAALHVCSSGGVVCAAPTGGAAGVLPGVAATLAEDFGIAGERLLLSLWATGAVGYLHDLKSTFAAEVAGCQVEIGAAGAMAAAAVAEAAGGTARQGCDAAATVFQNVMGSVCDLVQGVVEIPCHSRNAALASQAFLCADLVLGGYENPVPLDETIDAVDRVGRMLPEELRCTSRGGLALCPSALALPRLDTGTH